MFEHALFIIAGAGLSAASVYLVLVMVAAVRFRISAQRYSALSGSDAHLPPVSVLKPLHGAEPLLEECLESFFRQDYPEYELIFGARIQSDPALALVEVLEKKYPHVATQTIVSGHPGHPNAKVCLMEKMAPLATHPILFIADSDVHVAPDYLAQVVRPMLDPKVGMVTCLYRGVSTGGFWALLEALGMSIELASGVLVADLLEGMKFALGPTMVIRKEVLEGWGGLGVLRDYCADDFVMGALTHAAGRKVVLSHYVINHIVLGRSARTSMLHQLRWMKSSRFSRSLGHLGTGLTFAMPFGALALVAGWLSGNWVLGLGMLSVAVANRLVQALVVGWGVNRDRDSALYCWLYPLRDLLGFTLWCASFWGSEIDWRGERYQLVSGGRMVPKSRPGETDSNDAGCPV
ncbi:MAG TPA: bacteriohopanetetrol glucosamine biosynthesis glycosyltransferase HpnI [Terriglobia bacterium]|nr:bacteriohopanetetrol glucosamine biosynthesis glycosyltransferase HpnI [Terriglobia bacterium]